MVRTARVWCISIMTALLPPALSYWNYSGSSNGVDATRWQGLLLSLNLQSSTTSSQNGQATSIYHHPQSCDAETLCQTGRVEMFGLPSSAKIKCGPIPGWRDENTGPWLSTTAGSMGRSSILRGPSQKEKDLPSQW